MSPITIRFFLSLIHPEAREGKRGWAHPTAGPTPTRRRAAGRLEGAR